MPAVDPEGRIRHPLDVFHSTFNPDGTNVPAGYVPAADGLGQVEYLDSSAFGGAVTVEDDGTPLATAATTLDFVGQGVTATGAGAEKTITIPGEDTSLVEVASTGTTETVDCSVARTYDLTLTDNCTLTLTGAVNNEAHFVTILLRQDGTGSRLVTWPGSVVWPDGTAPTLDTTANAVDVVTLFSLDGGTVWYGFAHGSAVGSLDDLSDVTITSATEGDMLRYRSGFWVNETADIGRWELVVTGTAPPVAMTNDAEDDFLYAPV